MRLAASMGSEQQRVRWYADTFFRMFLYWCVHFMKLHYLMLCMLYPWTLNLNYKLILKVYIKVNIKYQKRTWKQIIQAFNNKSRLLLFYSFYVVIVVWKVDSTSSICNVIWALKIICPNCTNPFLLLKFFFHFFDEFSLYFF